MVRPWTVPKAWQLHFAEAMASLGAKRLRSEPSVYEFLGKNLYHFLRRRHPRRWTPNFVQMVLRQLSQPFLIKHLGELRSAGEDIPFLGRVLQRDEAGIHLQAPKPLVLAMLGLIGL